MFGEVLTTMRRTLQEAGVRMLMSSFAFNADTDASTLDLDALATVRDLRPRGVIVLGSFSGQGLFEQLPHGVPVVLVNSLDAPLEKINTVVRTDDQIGIGLVVGHLVSIGRRRLTFVGGVGGAVAQSRARTFRAACSAAGVTDFEIEPARFTFEAGAEAARRMLDAGRVPEAVVAANDLVALGVIETLEGAGVAVPGDCAVTGYDDIFVSRLHRVALTSVNPDNAEVGRQAAHALMRLTNGEQVDAEYLVRPVLAIRATTVPTEH
jgi:DNA-binding LacI/PurR family transcriptional regulator